MKTFIILYMLCCSFSLANAQTMTGGSVSEVTSDNFSQMVEKSTQPVVVDFYATWCQPCKKMGPVLDELSKEMTNVKFVKMNIDNAKDIAKRYGVSSLPTFVFIKNGQMVSKEVGMMSKEAFSEKIKQSLGS